MKRQMLLNLVAKWRREAKQYQAQVKESRAKKLPHAQMLSGMAFLRQCARELQEVLDEQVKKRKVKR